MLIVPIAYLIKQCRITNLVGWWPLQSSIGILTIDWGKSWGSWENNWCSSYMTYLFDNYQTTLFDISSNCLVCGNSDNNYGDKDGHELILAWIFHFQSMPSLSSKHVIARITNGPIVSVQELNIFKTCMLWMMFTIFATKKLEHQFLSDADMKRKIPKPGTNPGTQQVGVLWGDMVFRSKCWQQTTVNDLIEKNKKSSWW